MSSSDVINTIDSSFETDVMVRSQLGFVVVDFWAEWCAPCRTLGPVLEEVVSEFADRVTLVKADTEQNPEASQKFGVTGIPAVFGVLDGQVVDSFQGALPAPAIRDWIERCLQQEQIMRIQQQLEVAPDEAEATLREMLEDETSDALKVLLVQALHRQGKSEDANDWIDELSARGFLEPELESIRAELKLHSKNDVDVESLQQAADASPKDLELQFQLAEALASAKKYEDAFEICLNLVQLDRKGAGEKARLLMLDVFKILGDDSEVTRDYRRRLSMALY